MSKITKTEHAGAKNGGGHWGTRAEAKKVSKRKRRNLDQQEAQGDAHGNRTSEAAATD